MITLVVSFLSCVSKTEEQKEQKSTEYQMYEPSEMALLMQEFYEYNATLKQQILNGEPLSEMPEEFKTIHTAELTDASGRNMIFKSYAPAYVQTQQAVLDSSNTLDLTSRYNNTINVCLACHKTECVGPIPRIKKLLIR